LLQKYEIGTKTNSFHTHSDKSKLESIITQISEGQHLAYVSDAGTPGISDPGPFLVKELLESLPDVTIEVIPGADSVTTALAGAGIVFKEYQFLGFVPQKKGRKTFIEKLQSSDIVTVCFESSHRILKFLKSLSEVLGDRNVVVAKELTKMHENFFRGSAQEIIEIFTKDPKLEKGEFVVVVDVK
jgi:16S rRNA (cytidine1402-2'-O)-methyltransferase